MPGEAHEFATPVPSANRRKNSGPVGAEWRAGAKSRRFSEISGLRSLRKGWMNDANLNSINSADEQTSKAPRVVIVGGGFGGLAAAKALGKAPAEVILIDRTNHHVFQPLLYQVATSVLTPS